MKKILFKMMLLSCMVLTAFASMAQGSFAYQAIIRDSKGALVSNKTIGMRITLSNESNVYYVEKHAPEVNNYGNVNIMVGNGTVESGSFKSVPWNTMNITMKVEVSIDNNSSYTTLGTTAIQPVPYALYAETAGNEVNPLAGTSDGSPLFSVKDKNGDVVFAVYEDGIEVYIDENSAKAVGRGFSICKREATKAGETERLFTVGGEGTTVYVDDDANKAAGRGFSICGRNATKDGENNNLLTVDSDGTTVYVDGKNDGKAAGRGFSVCGREATKNGSDNGYLSVEGGNVNIVAESFNVADKKTDAEVFAIDNGKIKVQSDMVVKGDIGKVAEPVKCDITYELKMEKPNYESWSSLSVNDSLMSRYGDEVELAGIYETIYGMPNWVMAENNDWEQIIYFDKNGNAKYSYSDIEVALSQETLSVYASDKVNTTVKFILIGKLWIDDQNYKTVGVNCEVVINGSGYVDGFGER